MNPQVLTRITSARGRSGTTTAPWPTRSPTRRSESTVALSQPSETTPSFIRRGRGKREEGRGKSREPSSAIVPEFQLDDEVPSPKKDDDGMEFILGRRGA